MGEVRFCVELTEDKEYIPVIELDLKDGDGHDFTLIFYGNLSTPNINQCSTLTNAVAEILGGKMDKPSRELMS